MLINVSTPTIVYRILMSLSLSCALTTTSAGMCPPSRVLYPCECYDNQITCGQHSVKYSVKHILQDVSHELGRRGDKHFSAFVFENSVIDEFDDNMFCDLLFDNITIVNAANLTRIKSHAFNTTARSVAHFEQRGETKLGKRYLNQLFDALSSLINVRHISLELNSMKTFPMYAFSNDKRQTRVEWFSLRANALTRIENYAFYELTSLRHIRVKADRLIRIAAHSFDFEIPSNHIINIDLRNNQLTEYSFEIESFIGVNRPINLMLMANEITYLDERAFAPLLRSDHRHRIDLRDNPLVCNCSMAWLLRERDLHQHQVKNAVCNKLANIWSLEDKHFLSCLLNNESYAPKLVIRSQSFTTDPNLMTIAIVITVLELTIF